MQRGAISVIPSMSWFYIWDRGQQTGKVAGGGSGSGSVGGKELAGVTAALCLGTGWAVLSEIL